jgi:uridine phosphorylase
MSNYSESDLIINNGRIYHLGIAPEELAARVILVGDPDRVTVLAAALLPEIELEHFHRGLRTITGRTKAGTRITITTSGMGTPSLEIVVNELMALNEVDFSRRKRRSSYDPLTIIRVGTSGALQSDTLLGTSIISAYAIGLDNSGLFLEGPEPTAEMVALELKLFHVLNTPMPSTTRFRGRIWPYVSKADEKLVKKMYVAAQTRSLAHTVGITVTGAGFFASQGRDIARTPLTIRNLDQELAALESGIGTLRIENFEMESSFLFHFAAAHGYPAATICPTVAQRRNNTFASQMPATIIAAGTIAVDALS